MYLFHPKANFLNGQVVHSLPKKPSPFLFTSKFQLIFIRNSLTSLNLFSFPVISWVSNSITFGVSFIVKYAIGCHGMPEGNDVPVTACRRRRVVGGNIGYYISESSCERTPCHNHPNYLIPLITKGKDTIHHTITNVYSPS